MPTETDDLNDGGGHERGATGEPVRLRYPGTTAALATVRAEFDRWLTDQGTGDDERQLAVLVLAELATNAAAACAGADYEVTYQRIDDGDVELSVANRAAGSAVPPRADWGPDDPLARRGRGLGIVERLARSVRVDTTGDQVRITALLRAARSR